MSYYILATCKTNEVGAEFGPCQTLNVNSLTADNVGNHLYCEKTAEFLSLICHHQLHWLRLS